MTATIAPSPLAPPRMAPHRATATQYAGTTGRSCRTCGHPAPVRNPLVADYLDFMRRYAGQQRQPHLSAHADYCRRRGIPAEAAERLWSRWIGIYLTQGRPAS